MAKTKVILTHHSHKKGAEGIPGDTVTVDEKTAEAWIASGGARLPAEPEPKPAATPKDKT